MPFFPGGRTAQLVMNVAIVSYASATIATGVTFLLMYFLREIGVA